MPSLAPITKSLDQALEPYKVGSKIGEGSFGRVYKAHRRADSLKVAIKTVENILVCEQQTRSIVREVSILRQLNAMGGYSHTVKLYDLHLYRNSKDEVSIALVFDYHSKDLRKILDRSDQIVINDHHIVRVLYSLLCGLKFLHLANVMHRDVKPPNLLFQKDCQVVLCDFGLARTHRFKFTKPADRSKIAEELLADRKDRSKRPRALSPHTVTRFYRPPEVIMLNREYDHSVDLWSLGCVMIELLNCSDKCKSEGTDIKNRQPFRGTSCYPLSPCQDQEVEDQDQLKIILGILGKLDPEEKSFITYNKQLNHLAKCESSNDKVQFTMEYPKFDERLMTLFENLLQFNPKFRTSAGELLKSSLFDECRSPEMEKDPPAQVELAIDLEGEFSYDNLKSTKFASSDYLAMLQAEKAKLGQ